jgi:hypothetical protein
MENTWKVFRRIRRLREMYLCIQYMENTTNLGWFAVHKIGAFNIKTIYLTIILENTWFQKTTVPALRVMNY